MEKLVFHNELTSSRDSPLLMDPPYNLTLSITELTTPKEPKEEKVQVKKKNRSSKDTETEMVTDRAGNIPRPHNAFIIFRTDYAAKLKHIYDQQKISIRTISKLASKQWKKESESVKVFFKLLSDMYQERHRKLYPDYKYNPRRSNTLSDAKKIKLARRNELKRKRRERIITWCIHDDVEDNDGPDLNSNFMNHSQQNITRTDFQKQISPPATFINYTISSSSSLTFHSTTTSPFDSCNNYIVNNDNALSLSNSPNPSENSENSENLDFSFLANNNDNIETLLSLFNFVDDPTVYLN